MSRMASLGIMEKDLDEKFVLAAKKGGQKVNKASVCVYIRHRPTGISVKCQEERSQPLNRFLARRVLADKIESLAAERETARLSQIEKIRRQKRKRSRRAKEKVLRMKRIRSETKLMRRSPSREY